MTVNVTVGAPLNVSNMIDNQQEPTIAVDPRPSQTREFAASMTFRGSLPGVFIPTGLLSTGPGLFAGYTNADGSWSGRTMATGGPGGDSLPAGDSDPQAAFDAYGNLYLAYMAPNMLQFGTPSTPLVVGTRTLTDGPVGWVAGRQWIPSMWAGQTVTAYDSEGLAIETHGIRDNSATGLTLTDAWTERIRGQEGVTYRIHTLSFDRNRRPVSGPAIILLSSADGGRTFRFTQMMDTGPGVDYPSVATGPGRVPGEQSVWVAWKTSLTGNVLADGAPVTGLGSIGNFMPNEVVNGSLGLSFARAQVGPNGQLMVAFAGLATFPRSMNRRYRE